MFKWLTNIINKFRPKRKQSISEYDNRIGELSQRSEKLKHKLIKPFPTDWFILSTPQKAQKKLRIFGSYSFKQIVTLQILKEERIKKENARIEQVKIKVRDKLSRIDTLITSEKLQDATNTYDEILTLKPTIPNGKILNNEITQRWKAIQNLSQVLREREAEKQRKTEEERRRKEAEERKRQEEIAKREKERKEREFREKKEKEEKELAARRQREAEQIKRQEEKRKELERITAHTKVFKSDKDSIATVLKENEVKYFFHFTDVSNLKSIKEQGGLLSWYYCEQHNIDIPFAGGDNASRQLDSRHNLEDYVRLSFCRNHPMAYNVWIRNNKIPQFVRLKIKIDVAYFESTLFTDINAADNNHKIGSNFSFIKENINLKATKMEYVKGDDPNFKPRQAEVLVRTFIPIKYIENIDNPEPISFD